MTVIANVITALGTTHKNFVKGREDLENKWTSSEHPNYCIIKIGQTTEKSIGDLKRLVVIQTPVRHYQLTLV